MSSTILDALRNAQYNFNGGHPVQVQLAARQLDNALVLLDKGYPLDTEMGPLFEEYDEMRMVPDCVQSGKGRAMVSAVTDNGARILSREDEKRLYYDLLFEVQTKFENESRHETAKRYIREQENQSNPPEQRDTPTKASDE